MDNVVKEHILQRLVNSTNIFIRYQTLTLFECNCTTSNLNNERSELENNANIRLMLDSATQIISDFSFSKVHGATNTQLENLLPMLLDRGLNKSFSTFDSVFSRLIPILESENYADANNYHTFSNIILIPFLLVAGYQNDSLVDFYKKRLELTSNFCRNMDFDIFGDQRNYKGIPKTFQDRKIIRPELYENGKYCFPLIYDIYGHAAMYQFLDSSEQEQINNVLRYILAEPYQQFPFGYGILREPNKRNRYHAMGWDCVLPLITDTITSPVLHRMELLAAFPFAIQSKWFQKGLALLESYQDENGMFALPKSALQEKEACWLLGNHMGLGENRRKKDWALLEGTFRALRLKHHMYTHHISE